MKQELQALYSSIKSYETVSSQMLEKLLERVHELLLDEDVTGTNIFEDFYEFPLPSDDNDLDDWDERYLHLEGKTLLLVNERVGTLKTTMTRHVDTFNRKNSSLTTWIGENDDDVVWTAANEISLGDPYWKAYVDIDITSLPKNIRKNTASTLALGTVFFGKVDGVEQNMFMTLKGTDYRMCVALRDGKSYSPEDVDVIRVITVDMAD